MKNTFIDSAFLALLCYFMFYSFFVHHKWDITDERVVFLNDQKDDLKTECHSMLFELDKYKRMRMSYDTSLDDIEYIVRKLLNTEVEVGFNELKYLTAYCEQKHKMHVGFEFNEYQLLTAPILAEINEYLRYKLAYQILQRNQYSYYSMSSDILWSEFNLVEYWSNGKYHIELDYFDEFNLEKMYVKQLHTESNEYLFKPTEAGEHKIPVFLKQLDYDGNETMMLLDKRVNVLP